MTMNPDLPERYVCFRCGFQEEEHGTSNPYEVTTCPDCGEEGLMCTTLMIDIINDLYLEGVLKDEEEDPLLEEVLKEIDFENSEL